MVPIEKGKKMGDMLAAGELAAAIGVEANSPDVKPLIPNALEAGLAALRQRGHYPINHTVVIKDELIAAHPDLAADVFNAFARRSAATSSASRPARSRSRRGRRGAPAGDGDHRRSLPYGIAPNRKVIEELIGHALTQGIITRPVTAEELFAREHA